MTKRNVIMITIAVTCLIAAGLILWINPTRVDRSKFVMEPVDMANLPKRTPRVIPSREDIALARRAETERELAAALPADSAEAEAHLFDMVEKDSPDYDVKRWIGHAFENLPVAESNVERHIGYVRDKTGRARDYAWRLLMRHDHLPPSATGMFIAGLDGDDADYCAQALRQVKPPAAEAVEPLLALVKQYSPESEEGANQQKTRLLYSAVLTLQIIGDTRPAVMETFTDFAANGRECEIDWSVLAAIRRALANLHGRIITESSARALVAMLGGEDYDARGEAAESLGKFGEFADFVVPALIDELHVYHPDVREAIAAALGKLIRTKPAAITAALVTVLDDDRIDVRVRASQGITRGGVADPAAVQHLIGLLAHRDDDVRWRAVTALGDLRAGDQAGDALRERLDDAHLGIRATAAVVTATPQ